MSRIDIETVWRRLEALSGEIFETKTGKEFTFSMTGTTFVTDRTDYPLGISDFAKVLELSPLEGPGMISKLVRGSSYIWAVLHDPRIRHDDW